MANYLWHYHYTSHLNHQKTCLQQRRVLGISYLILWKYLILSLSSIKFRGNYPSSPNVANIVAGHDRTCKIAFAIEYLIGLITLLASLILLRHTAPPCVSDGTTCPNISKIEPVYIFMGRKNIAQIAS